MAVGMKGQPPETAAGTSDAKAQVIPEGAGPVKGAPGRFLVFSAGVWARQEGVGVKARAQPDRGAAAGP